MKAFVAGATGQTGQRIVEELVSRNIPVRALVRDEQKARNLLPSQVELIVGDILQPETLVAALGDSTVVLCATGARPSFDPTGPYQVDFQGTKNLVKAAQDRKIQHFVLVSSLCVSQLFHPLNLFWLILVWKKQAEEFIRKSGITYTIVRPGGLKNDDNSDEVIMQGPDTLFEGSISRKKVARVCVESLFEKARWNQIMEIIAKPLSSS
ncbi:SDR family oxidoreductase [Cylindrospermopsis raciborskii CS-506_D]|uniref:SDR family oxidoreductase n=1 Tax=Cylindrospermopsis raciborskii CS-506_A TaxID=2585140 RepID=A0A838WXL5_9CYAN|nr:SDR family oxidoreductase [Cylindrospermopsis raciborskii]MBA4447265.1 SDR family oxidoreductase [Cylindrospermopsis raciborskii CS-506_C]MBA4451542.1 SDR family oxidoreductase [Cylindrospermopsis raciborskii CS-506_D]MBA4458127.1 SDR family oxidoreductase [Cylindrospermopsis raciborskii CS-506_B]MBA4467522.1 SDR family oxidoreductase [Cylindrospermopsis raciborskii CS-506_A]OHY31992.1 epimerase [Cylindrospermopsis raciborskii CS-508]